MSYTVTVYPKGITAALRHSFAFGARFDGISAARRYAAEAILSLRAEGIPGIARGDETAVVEGDGRRLVARLGMHFRGSAGRRVTEVHWSRLAVAE